MDERHRKLLSVTARIGASPFAHVLRFASSAAQSLRGV
jgi:hypothetical protein